MLAAFQLLTQNLALLTRYGPIWTILYCEAQAEGITKESNFTRLVTAAAELKSPPQPLSLRRTSLFERH
jgi:hypothetical protein